MHKNARYMEPIQLDCLSSNTVELYVVHVNLHSVLEEESCLLTALKEQGSRLLFFYVLQ